MKIKTLLMVAAFAAMSFAKTTSVCAQESNPATEMSGHWQFGANVGLTVWALTNESHYTVTAGWRFNRNHFLGLGLGYERVEESIDDPQEWNNGDVSFLPVFASYEYYLPFRRHDKHSFLFGCDGGVGYYPDKTLTKKDTDRWMPFARCRIGADFQVCRYMGLQVSLDGLFSQFGGVGVSVGVRF